MKAFLQKHHRLFFYGTWFLLGIVQAAFTELQDDEAYYWVYSKFLDWGYFDHPPMIAVLIKVGTALFPNELGVRFFPLLLSTLTLVLTEKLIQQKNRVLYYAICLSIAALQVAGFMAVPDMPLLFFTALFFLCYQHFIQTPSWKNTFLLSFAVSCLLYSKYHSVLILFFTLLSNLKLLKQYKIYLVGLIALLLFMPHLWWQYQHNWISFKYHLFESNVNPYKLSYTLDYIVGQILITGPISGIILLWSTLAYRTKTLLEKALKYTAVGIFCFFLASSFRGRVEANWTAPVIVPVLVLTHNYLQQHLRWKRWLLRLVPLTLLLVLLVRIVMVVDVLPVDAVVQRFHAWKGWPQQLKIKTHNLPIVFNNSYQRASKYWFYTGQPAYSLNDYRERRNNYNFWPLEDSILGKEVYVMDIYGVPLYQDSIQARLWTIGYSRDSSFHSFAKVAISADQPAYVLQAHTPVSVGLTITMPDYYRHYLQQHPSVNEKIKIGIFKGADWVTDVACPFNLQQAVVQSHQQILLPLTLPKGNYFMRFAIASDTPFYTHNSNKIKLEVL